MSWYFDYYQIGKRRQWVGAPIPICVSFRSDEPYFGSMEKRSYPRRPRLIIAGDEKSLEAKEILKNEKRQFKGANEASWIAQLDTTKIRPGTYDLTFVLNKKESITASDEPLIILTPDDYRQELAEEADERFMRSLDIRNTNELREFMKGELNRKLANLRWDSRLSIDQSRTEGLGALDQGIASAPISWILDALATEYIFLSVVEPNPGVWFFRIEKDVLVIGFYVHNTVRISKEMKATVENRELGDLYLLNVGNDFTKFAVDINFSHRMTSYIQVQFSMYEGSLRGGPVTPPLPPPLPAGTNTQEALRYKTASG